MTRRLATALASTLLTITIAFAAPAARTIAIDVPKAGIDYPTDARVPVQLRGASILVIDSNRIVVSKKASLSDPKAGLDYPTSSAVPARLKSAKILVVDGRRMAITLEPAKAGIDVPTDSPAATGTIWILGGARVAVANITRIERGVAGIDFPTDGPPTLDRDFYVIVLRDGTRTRI
jgi:hypothetical protein